MSKEPTEKQIEFASKLGIDIPEKTTRAGLSRLIDHALRRDKAEDAGEHHLPNEIALRCGRDWNVPSSRRRAVIESIRESGVRESSVIEVGQDSVRAVVIAISPTEASIAWLSNGDRATVLPKSNQYPFQLIYNPPKTHAHEFVLTNLLLKAADKPNSAPMKPFRVECAKFVSERLASEYRYRNDHGEFWLKASVEPIVTAFVEECRAKKERQRMPKPPPAKEKRHCVNCGCEVRATQKVMPQCGSCCGKEVSADRYCRFCGKPFTYVQVPRKSVWACASCPDCR